MLQFSIGPIGAGLLGVITLPIITWFFNTEDIGRLSMAQVSLSFGVLILSLGMHQAFVREYHEEENKFSLFKMVVIPSIIVFLFFICFLYFMPWSISVLLFDIYSIKLSILMVVALFSLLITNFLIHLLRMEERGIAYSVSKLLPKIIFLFLISMVVWSNDFNISFNTLLSLHVISIVFTFLLFIWVTKGTWVKSLSSQIEAKKIKSMLHFSLPLVAGSIAFWGVTAMDRFFLKSLSSFDELGLYSVAISFAGAATILSTLFSNIWQPILYKWVKEGIDPNKIQVVTEFVFLAIATIWTLVGIFSYLILYLLPIEYESVRYLLVLSMVYPLMYLLSEATKVGIGIQRKSSYEMLTSVIAFIVNAVLNYLFIPLYGAKGAAIASAIAFFIFLIVRTEFSAYIWVSLPRTRIYGLVILFLLSTFYMAYTGGKSEYNTIIWVSVWLLSMIFYKNRVIEVFKIVKLKYKG